MIGIHKIGRNLPDSERLNSKVGADTMAYEIMTLFKRRNVKYKLLNDLSSVTSEIDTLLLVSGVSEYKPEYYQKIRKEVSNVIYLIDDPKLTRRHLVELSDLVLEPSLAVKKYENGDLFPPELWAASYSNKMVDPSNDRPIRLSYWGSDTGRRKAERLEKYFPNHSVTNENDVLYLKSKRYNRDTRVDITELEDTRSKSKFTICVNDMLLTERQYYNGRIYEALVSGIMPIVDSGYFTYNLTMIPIVKSSKMLESVIHLIDDDGRIKIVRDLQAKYKDSVKYAEDAFLKVIK